MKHLMRHLWTSHLGPLAPLTMALLLAMAPPVAQAATKLTTSKFYGLNGSGVYDPPVSCGCPSGDTMVLSGAFHVTGGYSNTAPAPLPCAGAGCEIDLNTNLIDVVGKSTLSGCVYRAVGAAKTTVNYNPYTVDQTFDLMPEGQGSCPKFPIHVHGVMHFNDADGSQDPASTFFIGEPN